MTHPALSECQFDHYVGPNYCQKCGVWNERLTPVGVNNGAGWCKDCTQGWYSNHA